MLNSSGNSAAEIHSENFPSLNLTSSQLVEILRRKSTARISIIFYGLYQSPPSESAQFLSARPAINGARTPGRRPGERAKSVCGGGALVRASWESERAGGPARSLERMRNLDKKVELLSPSGRGYPGKGPGHQARSGLIEEGRARRRISNVPHWMRAGVQGRKIGPRNSHEWELIVHPFTRQSPEGCIQ